jgi:hypothetical protein
MELWILRPHNSDEDKRWEYDCVFGFIIQATMPSRARLIAADYCGDEGREVWLDPQTTSCKKLKATRTPGIVMRDFHAG